MNSSYPNSAATDSENFSSGIGRPFLVPVESPRLSRLARIDLLIQSTEDRKLLRLLNKAWWREWFQRECGR